MKSDLSVYCLVTCGLLLLTAFKAQGQIVFPGSSWEHRTPSELGLNGSDLEQLAKALGGRGCVIKDGYVAITWGDQGEKGDWLSSAKPVLSTLLFFAIHEGLVKGVDQPISDFGWNLKPKDRQMAFRHLANMISGYARPESPGAAWAYNDYAIQLYQKTLFDKVFRAVPEEAVMHPKRLGALQFEDGLSFSKGKRRLSASVRDFARVAWFWLNRGKWGDVQVLPRHFFDDYMKPHTPKDLPHTAKADTDDYLGIGSYGGGSDHFTDFGAGIYGFNWWFNDTGRLHPDRLTWPDAPKDTIMSIGAGGNCSALIPSKNLILVCARGDWGKLKAGDPQSKMNQHLKTLAGAEESNKEMGICYFPPPESEGGWRKLEDPEEIRRFAGMDPVKLDSLKQWLLKSDDRPFAALVIRNGYIVLEVERERSGKTHVGDVKSCAKAICATVLSIASEESQKGNTPRKMTFDDPAFNYIPWAYPLSDPRKKHIKVKQLLNHTSGITPEGYGIRNRGRWEYILGHGGDGKTAKLFFDPGTDLRYSTHALYHASLVCENVTGKPYDQFAIEYLLKPLGIEHWRFGTLEGDERHGGNHPSHALGLPAREMARVAYCMLRNGKWDDRQVVPQWFVEETAAPTHSVKGVTKKSFGRDAQSWSHGWELPALMGGEMGRDIPVDARFKPGSGGQLIGFVPSLDLVVTRQTGKSGDWQYEEYLRLACAAVLSEGTQ